MVQIKKLFETNNQSNHHQIVGGDFELTSIPSNISDSYKLQKFGSVGTWTSSGRASLAILLQDLVKRGIEQIVLPSYLCSSILLPIRKIGLKYSFYNVDRNLESVIEPQDKSAILLIHYFGWFNKLAIELRKHSSSESFYLIEDVTHAFLSDWYTWTSSSEFVFMSLRKFGPVPIGGWCSYTYDNLPISKEIESLAWKSIAARLLRAQYVVEPSNWTDFDVEKFYLNLLHQVEVFLDQNPTVCKLPKIAYDLIMGLNWHQIGMQRRSNWLDLHTMINDKVDALITELPEDVVPLGYVIKCKNRDKLKDRLAKRHIFCPVHWQLPNIINEDNFPESVALSQQCLTLPIDQRYSFDDMARIAEVVQSEL